MKKTHVESANPMDFALRYLGNRARTVREMELYLDEKQFGEADVMASIERLLELGLLNDEQFATDFVESRLRTKPISRNALLHQLTERKLPQELARDAVAQISDETEEENCLLVMKGFWSQLSYLPDRERIRRVYARALTRGYSYDTIRSAQRCLSEGAVSDLDTDCTDFND